MAEEVATLLGTPVRGLDRLTGGGICAAHRLQLDDGRVAFAKHRGDAPGMFRTEAAGLAWLAEAGARVPQVLGAGERVLVLEWVEPGDPGLDHGDELGHMVARLHRAGAPSFGWDRPGFIGHLPQDNEPTATWAEFWWQRRLEPMARLARDRRRIDPAAGPVLHRLARVLDDRCGPPEAPARLHGDLWGGNVHVGPGGAPWLVDPAPYGGHREVDLAMLSLFGTFSPGSRWLRAYQEVHPLAEGWQDRVALWQLWPLLVHAVLFGGGYGDEALRVARSLL